MTSSTKTTHKGSWLSRLIVSLTIGLMMLALGAATAVAGTGTQATHVAGNDARVISTGGGGVSLNEDDDEDDEDDEDEASGGGGLPATDMAPPATAGDAGTPIPAVALLVIAGLAGGAATVTAKRSVRS